MMKIEKNNKLLSRAKALRREMTPHERKLWYLFLRNYPVRFYKQKIIGNCIVDFYCASAGLVIELDGTQHYEHKGQTRDAVRDEALKNAGFHILRFSNREIDRDFEGVCRAIDYAIRGERE